MENVRDLLARSLPPLLFIGGTVNPSINPEWISAKLLHPWESFSDEITMALQDLDLSAHVCLTDAPEDVFSLAEVKIWLRGGSTAATTTCLDWKSGLCSRIST